MCFGDSVTITTNFLNENSPRDSIVHKQASKPKVFTIQKELNAMLQW